jgi:hypothetical protein
MKEPEVKVKEDEEQEEEDQSLINMIAIAKPLQNVPQQTRDIELTNLFR